MEKKEILSVSLDRAKQVLADGDLNYSRFLCYEELKYDASNIEARKLLYKIRSQHSSNNSLLSKLQKYFQFAKIKIYQYVNKKTEDILYELEKYIDLCQNQADGLRLEAEFASDKKIKDLALFCLELIPNSKKTDEDFIFLAKEYFELKKFNHVIELTNTVLERSPESIDAKDLANEASIRKSMTSDNEQKTKSGKPQPIDISSLIPTVKKKPQPQPQLRYGPRR